MRTVLAAFLIAMSAQAGAQDWTGADYSLIAGALALAAIDWGQTRDLATRQQQSCFRVDTPTSSSTGCFSTPLFREASNPFLPAHPTTAQVDKSFAIGMAVTAGLAYVLPQSYRRWFLGGVIVLETGTVIHNHQIGLRVQF